MTDPSLFLVSTFWRIASALALAVIGLLALRGGAARPRGAFPFGMFAITWGAQIALGNLITSTADPTLAGAIFLAFLACIAAATYFLVAFAASHARTPLRRSWRVAHAATAAVSLLAAVLILLAPSLFLASVEISPWGRPLVHRGPLTEPLMTLQFAALGLTLATLFRAWRDSPSPRTAVRHAGLLAGIGVSMGATGGLYLVRYGLDLVEDGSKETLNFAVVFALMAILTVWIAAQAWRHGQGARTPAERAQARMLSVALLVPLAWGSVEGVLNHGPLPNFSTLGLWRIAGVAIIAYGLARWRLPDLPQRAARAAATGAGVGAAAAGGVATFGAVALVAAGSPIPAFAGTVVLFAGLVPGVRLARRLFARASERAWPRDDDGIYGARVDAYRAALEASLARNSLEEDADFLGALRERFGITESEDRLLRHYARACVLAPRQGDASAAFERLRLLGEGGAGRTWLARDRVRDRLVVLKEPLERWQREPGVREAVLREARLAAKVRHANVIHVEEVLEHRGSPIIVMEFAEGGSLAEMLRRRGVLPWREAVDLVVPILRGVEAIHAHGILHRDLKPSNVLLTMEGQPKIADFGIAVAARRDDPKTSDKTAIEVSTGVGTYAYQAPEVRAGAPADKRADVYACAAILHEALYGSPPGLQAPVLAENDVPAELSRALARALAPEPAQRPASARSLAEELTTLGVRARIP